MLLEHLAAVAYWQVASPPLPGPNLSLGFPTRIFVQFVIGRQVGSVNHVVVLHVQSILFQNAKQFQTLLWVVLCGKTEIQSMSVGIALLLRTIKVVLKGMECECEQARSWKSGDFKRPSGEQSHMFQIVMRDFVRDDKCHH